MLHEVDFFKKAASLPFFSIVRFIEFTWHVVIGGMVIHELEVSVVNCGCFHRESDSRAASGLFFLQLKPKYIIVWLQILYNPRVF